MKTILLFLLAVTPIICIGQTKQPAPDALKQELIMKYPILSNDEEDALILEVRNLKDNIHEVYTCMEKTDSLFMPPFDRATLNEADILIEQLPGSFQDILYAASLYDIMRAYCYDGTKFPNNHRKELFNLLINLAENLYSIAFDIAGTTDEVAVSASSLAEIRIRIKENYYGYDIMPLYKECFEMTVIDNYKAGILERIINYLSDYKNPVPNEKIKAVLPYKKMLADIVPSIKGFTPDIKANIIQDCARYCLLAQDDDADYYFNQAAKMEEASTLPPYFKQLEHISIGAEYANDPIVNFALSCNDYNTAMSAIESMKMICNETHFYSLEDIYGEKPSFFRIYQSSDAYPIHIATIAKIKSRFEKDDADKYKTEAFLSAAKILIYDKLSLLPEDMESRLRFLTPAITLQYSNSDPGLAYNAALFIKHLQSNEYNKLYQYCDIQTYLKEDEYAVEFVNYYDDRAGKELYDALILSKDEPLPTRVSICEEAELLSLHATGQKIYQSGLYNLIWSKLEKEIPEGARLLFASSGLLNILNIEAAENQDGKRACDRWDIRRLTSTKQICLQHAANHHFSKAAILGRTDNLTHTRYEVNEINRLMRSEGILTDVLIDDDCTESNLMNCMSGSTDILHIAAHAFFLDNDTIPSPLQSGLMLLDAEKVVLGKTVPGNSTDNMVFSSEIAEMPLDNCSLAVLSACETGLGFISADGISGLQQAFKQAGVQTIVMSLWKMNDMTTSRLMTVFYRNLLSGVDAHRAMYTAQDYIRNIPEYSHPYYWAGFIVLD